MVFLIPLAVFGVVVLIVAIVVLVGIRDKEMDVHQKLYVTEMEHQRKMQELNQELQRIRQGS
jgi:membrane protein insertase Oxa1/YidC/SpoIIIJ